MTFVKLNNRPARSFNNLMDDLFATVPSILRDDIIAPDFKSSVPVNIRETENEYVLELMAAGFQKGDFKINLDNDTLTISAEKKVSDESRSEKYVRREFRNQSFSRSFTVDEKINAENIVAAYENGVLTLNLPKKQDVKPSAKEITIR